jgi:hypothetical protein
VFADLKPYLCTFNDCVEQFTVMPSREMWAEHEFSKHRFQTFYDCHLCLQTHKTEQTLLVHLQAEHDDSGLDETRMQSIVSAGKRTEIAVVSELTCPMCDATGWETKRKFIQHVGRHMESIVLPTLPPDDEPETDSGSGVSEDHGSENSSIQRRGHDDDVPLIDIARVFDGDPFDKRHVKHHEVRHMCTFSRCTSQFRSKARLRLHEAIHQIGPMVEYVCFTCNIHFGSKAALAQHRGYCQGRAGV